MTSNALISEGKNACASSQRYKNNSVFWLAQMMLLVMTLHKFPPFDKLNVILNALLDKLLTCQYSIPTTESKVKIQHWIQGQNPD